MSTTSNAEIQQLHELARLYGVEVDYTDGLGRHRQAPVETLLAVVRALGAPVEQMRDIPQALSDYQAKAWQRPCAPVVVAWEGRLVGLVLRIPEALSETPLSATFELETGRSRRLRLDRARLRTIAQTRMEGTRYLARRLTLPGKLPPGYHRLRFELGKKQFETLVISAPVRAYSPPELRTIRNWGVFLPLYALRSQSSREAGDLAALEALGAWAHQLGAGVVATLPLLAAFLDEPFEPSPYLPASRLFWNEFYLDLTRISELRHCPAAQALMSSTPVQEEMATLRSVSFVDHRRLMALKHKILGELARCFFTSPSARTTRFQRFLKEHPEVEDYACFRGVCEGRRAPWPRWPRPLQDGTLRVGDYSNEVKRYHLYVQWLMHEQIEAFSEQARRKGMLFYLDLPLGVHAASYDVWRNRRLFLQDMCGGAPPDAVFTGGQNWGFPPLHPEKIREAGYAYFLACLRHHLCQARLLRIDHVMGLHRLFWIPQGMDSPQGAYVQYHSEEFYAILTLESHRHKAGIVGENLGNVPPYVNPTLRRHNIHGMYMGQYALRPDSQKPLQSIPRGALASLNSHDIFPFVGFWQGLDIDDRLALGFQTEHGAREEREYRARVKAALVSFLQRRGRLKADANDLQAILRAWLAHLAASRAPILMVNLEDLWLETQPQNVPGTGQERPNWQRKARYALEEFCQMPTVIGTLQQISRRRRRG